MSPGAWPEHDSCVLLLTAQGVVAHASRSVAQLLGFEPDELQGTAIADWLRPGAPPEWLAQLGADAGPQPAATVSPAWFRHRHREWVRCDTTLVPAARGSARILRIAAGRRVEGLWASVAQAITTGLLVVDARTQCVLSANAAARRWLGAAVAREGASLWELLPVEPPQLCAALEQLETSPRVTLGRVECSPAGADAAPVWAEISVAQVAAGEAELYCVCIEDASRYAELEQKLRHERGLEDLGRVASGVAHDFHNLLGVILGYAELLLAGAEGEDAEDAAREIQLAASRGTEVTRRLLAFSRPHIYTPRVMNINELIEGMSNMLQRLIGERVQLVLKLDPGLVNCRADPSQVEMAVFNLALNARDAMSEGGQLLLQTSNRQATDGGEGAGNGDTSRTYAVLNVRDNGSGIPPEIQARIFEPFFTTKGEAGTGLGLATTQGIIQQCGGMIEVESQPGAGTTFRLLFPACNEAATETLAHLPRQPLRRRPSLRAELLFIDSDDALRPMLAQVLRKAGATVIEAASPGDALAEVRGRVAPPDLLILGTPLSACGATPADAAWTGLLSKPVLLLAQPHGPEWDGEAVLKEGWGFLPKPFAPAALVEKVQQMLAGPLRSAFRS